MASSSLEQLEQAHEERVSALLPALCSAALACNRRCVDRTDRAALPDAVVLLISGFLDFARPQFWSIPRACGRHEGALGDLRLLQRLAARESRDLDLLYREHLFNQALVNAVENRSLDVVQWLCTTYLPTGAATAAMEKASEKGELEIMQWLGEHKDASITWNPRFMDAAAGNGHLHLLRWLERHPKNAGCTRNAMNRAVEQGHLEVVKWLHERYPDVRSYNALPLAARSGHLEVSKFLHEHGHNLPRELDCAVESGKLEMIQWFYHDLQITNCSTAGMDFAARSGNLEVLKWLHLRSWYGCSEFAMNWAVVNGHLDVAQWLHENRIEGCSDFVVSLVAQEGRLDGIQWLYEHRQECRSSDVSNTIQCAAAKGHLHVMEWVCEHFEGWSFHSSMDLAAENGHLEVLKWLHERDARCSAAAMDLAACNNHLEVVKWLHANRLEGCTVRAMDRAARAGHIEIVKWLHVNRSEGCTTAAMDTAGSYEMLRWLHENRSEGCTTAAMENAVKNGDFDAVLFLHANRQEGCSTETVEAIAQSKTENVALLQWLYENYREMLDLDALRTELALSYHPVRDAVGLEESDPAPPSASSTGPSVEAPTTDDAVTNAGSRRAGHRATITISNATPPSSKKCSVLGQLLPSPSLAPSPRRRVPVTSIFPTISHVHQASSPSFSSQGQQPPSAKQPWECPQLVRTDNIFDHVSEEYLRTRRTLFQVCDLDEDGKVTPGELDMMLQLIGPPKSEIRRLIARRFPTTDTADFKFETIAKIGMTFEQALKECRDYILTCAAHMQLPPHTFLVRCKPLKLGFRKCDNDETEYITKKELEIALQKLEFMLMDEQDIQAALLARCWY